MVESHINHVKEWMVFHIKVVVIQVMVVTQVKVCCPFEGFPMALEDAARSKMYKYQPLRQSLLQNYTSVEILPFIVGALGSWYPPNDGVLSRLHIGWKYAFLMRRLGVVSAIFGSQTICICGMKKEENALVHRRTQQERGRTQCPFLVIAGLP
eukprot:Em0007g1216a